jgi:hypothetical protein
MLFLCVSVVAAEILHQKEYWEKWRVGDAWDIEVENYDVVGMGAKSSTPRKPFETRKAFLQIQARM